ncbi:DNA cytosine methyltransferase [Chitinophaga tropicalis]|uniref:Cytosine-specific methyltransferase n=1 Tax=Chitinophaga tropicalis TaxID=2683588 RepID=A0A7K1U0B7_9BACT|nr:DNA (cytosine-5-)-methyltransferase [Chitinophaga tropicalis]
MKHGSLFSGLGGFDLAATWMGWENIFHCEIDPFCQKILQHYWPNAKSYQDIRAFPAAELRGQVDIITGGFPCQPFSHAGNRQGTADDRYLWPQMFRVITTVQPRWVVAENVPGIIDIQRGMVFENVQTDLETAGYQVWTVVLPACSVGAPHLRNRVWIIAYAQSYHDPGNARTMAGSAQPDPPKDGAVTGSQGSTTTGPGTASNTDGPGLEGTTGPVLSRPTGQPAWCNQIPAWNDWPAVPPVCWPDDGVCPRLDNISFPRWRKESIKAFGNAIVPQVAYQLFKIIAIMEQQTFEPHLKTDK